MKQTFLIAIPFVLFACSSKKQADKAKNENVEFISLAENIESTTPLATTDEFVEESGQPFAFADAMQVDMEKIGIDYSNKKIGFKGREKIFNSIINAIKKGKLKAYRNYPDEELSVNDVNGILVQWDSTTTYENPEQPGTFISAPTKMEISSYRVCAIKSNETIEMDTINYKLNKKINFISFYIYKHTETGETVGQMKLFDVKLND